MKQTKKLLSLILSAVLLVNSSRLEGAATNADLFASLSHLPQFQLIPPRQVGQMVDYYNAPNSKGPLVVLIQDLHANYSAQKNIAKLLEFLADRLGREAPQDSSDGLPFRLAVEGAQGPVDTTILARYPDPGVRRTASDFLLNEAEITGAEYFVVQRGLSGSIIGAEDNRLYSVNRELFRKTFAERQQLVQSLEPLQAQLRRLSRQTYRGEVADVERTWAAFEKGQLGAEETLTYLLEKAQGIDIETQFPALARFAKNAHIGGHEHPLSATEIRKATELFLVESRSSFSPEVRKNIAALAAGAEDGPYYEYLRELIYRQNLFLAVPPDLARYLEYRHTLRVNGMAPLVHEMRQLTFQIQSREAKDPKAKDLLDVLYDIDLLLRVANLQAMEIEVRRFGPRLNRFVALTEALLSGGRVSFKPGELRELISSSIDFYVMAMLRNKPMIDHVLSLASPAGERLPATKAVPAGTVVLIAGGFHTNPLTQLLKQRQVSYVVLCPDVDRISDADHELYIRRLNGEHLSMEQVLASRVTRRGNRYRWSSLWRSGDTGLSAGVGVGALVALAALYKAGHLSPDLFMAKATAAYLHTSLMTQVHEFGRWLSAHHHQASALGALGSLKLGFMSLAGFLQSVNPIARPAYEVTNVRDLLKNQKTLVFSEDVDAIDAQLTHAMAPSDRYLRITIRNERDLRDLWRTVTIGSDNKPLSGEGPLADLLRKGGTILIDYNFNDPNEIDQKLVEELNSLFVAEPYFRNIRFDPSKIKLIGVVSDRVLTKYSGAFRSRFSPPVSMKASYDDPLETLPKTLKGPRDSAVSLELFKNPFFRDTLVGRFFYQNGRLQAEEGALLKALREGKPLVIRGGDWDHPDLKHFIRQLLLRRQITFNGVTYELPADFQIIREEVDYSQGISKKRIAPISTSETDPVWVINEKTQDLILSINEVLHGNLEQHPGLATHEHLRVRITGQVADWVWHMLMHAPGQVEIELAPGITPPGEYESLTPSHLRRAAAEVHTQPWTEVQHRPGVLVHASDLSYAETVFLAEQGPTVFIPVTAETKLDHLIHSIEIEGTTAKGYQFGTRQKGMIDALLSGTRVVLVGIEANPALALQLESALQEQPYLMVNGHRMDLRTPGTGQLVLAAGRPASEWWPHVREEAALPATDDDLMRVLAQEFPQRFDTPEKREDFARLRQLEKLFQSIPNPPPGLYPERFELDLARLRLLYRYPTWVEAFEGAVISDYLEHPEVAAYMRTMVRLVFRQDPEGTRPNTVHGRKVERLLKGLLFRVPWTNSYWQFTDSLSLDLLEKHMDPSEFAIHRDDAVFGEVRGALIRHHTGARQAYYRYAFDLPETVPGTATFDTETKVGEYSDSAQQDAALRALKIAGAAFFKGRPGSGKSHTALEIGKRLGFEKVDGPITAGPDLRYEDLIVKRDFNGSRTVVSDRRIAEWAKRKTGGLLIVDEGNLTEAAYWNFLRGLFPPHGQLRYVWIDGQRIELNENHLVVFTGNQEFLTGRRFQELFRHFLPTIHFGELDEAFLNTYLREKVLQDRKEEPEKLVNMMLSLHELFSTMGTEQRYSLRDVQELIERVNHMTPAHWTPEQVVHHAWQIYHGLFDAEEREALRFLIMKKYGVSLKNLDESQIEEVQRKHGLAFQQKGLTLVDSAARMVGMVEDFLEMRAKRLALGVPNPLQGKRGMIFQGASGLGKDVFLVETLRAQGMVDCTAMTAEQRHRIPAAQRYYSITASPDFNYLVGMIKQARSEGAIIIISEMNLLTSGLLEGKLNDVLTGDAVNGFALFGTVNDADDFAGREAFSTALQNRVLYTRLPDYTEDDLDSIAKQAARGTDRSEEELLYIVRAHVWIRSQITSRAHHPTPRELLRAIASPLSAEAAVQDVYGLVYLNKLLEGHPLPARDELLHRPREDRSEFRKGVIQKMARFILPRQNRELTVRINPHLSEHTAGQYDFATHTVELRPDVFNTDLWQTVLLHEASHALFSRGMNELILKENADLWQDMEDVRHTSAFDSYFPRAGVSPLLRNYRRFKEIAQHPARQFPDLLVWMRQSTDTLTPRHMYQYTLALYARGEISEAQVDALARVLAPMISPSFPINPFELARPHLENARRYAEAIPLPENREAAWAIPSTLDQDQVSFQQYLALTYLSEMQSDFANIPRNLRPPRNNTREVAKALAALDQSDFEPTQFEPTVQSSVDGTPDDLKAPSEAEIKIAQRAAGAWRHRRTLLIATGLAAVILVVLVVPWVAAHIGGTAVPPATLPHPTDTLSAIARGNGIKDTLNSILQSPSRPGPGSFTGILPGLWQLVRILGLAFGIVLAARILFGLIAPSTGSDQDLFGLVGAHSSDGDAFGEASPEGRVHVFGTTEPLLIDDVRRIRFNSFEPSAAELKFRDRRWRTLTQDLRKELDRLTTHIFRPHRVEKYQAGSDGALDIDALLSDPTRPFLSTTDIKRLIPKELYITGHAAKDDPLLEAFLYDLSTRGVKLTFVTRHWSMPYPTLGNWLGEVDDVSAEEVQAEIGSSKRATDHYEILNLGLWRKALEADYLYAAIRRWDEESSASQAKGDVSEAEVYPNRENLTVEEELKIVESFIKSHGLSGGAQNHYDGTFALHITGPVPPLNELAGLTHLTALTFRDTDLADLRILSQLPGVNLLTVYGGTVRSLAGAESARGLRQVQIEDVTGLTSIRPLRDLPLQLLKIDNVPIEDLHEAPRSLDHIELRAVPDQSLGFLRELNHLQRIAVDDHILRLQSDILEELHREKKILVWGSHSDYADFMPKSKGSAVQEKEEFSSPAEDPELVRVRAFLKTQGLEEDRLFVYDSSGYTLNLSNSRVQDLSALSGLRGLRILHIEGTLVKDLSPLRTCPGLAQVYAERTSISLWQIYRHLSAFPRNHSFALIHESENRISAYTMSTISLLMASLKEWVADQRRYLLRRWRSRTWAHLSPEEQEVILKRLIKRSDMAHPETAILRKRDGTLTVYLRGAKLTDEFLEALPYMTAIDVLYLSDTSLRSLEPLRSLRGLRQLGISETSVSDLEPISRLPLDYLIIEKTLVTDLRPLQQAQQLHHLSIGGGFYDHLRKPVLRNLAPLVDIPNLARLDVAELDPRANWSPIGNVPGLKVLHVDLPTPDLDERAIEFDMSILRPLAATLEDLKVKGHILNFRDVQYLTRLGLFETDRYLTDLSALEPLINLQILYLNSSQKITNLRPLFGMPRLRDVYLTADGKNVLQFIREHPNRGIHVTIPGRAEPFTIEDARSERAPEAVQKGAGGTFEGLLRTFRAEPVTQFGTELRLQSEGRLDLYGRYKALVGETPSTGGHVLHGWFKGRNALVSSIVGASVLETALPFTLLAFSAGGLAIPAALLALAAGVIHWAAHFISYLFSPENRAASPPWSSRLRTAFRYAVTNKEIWAAVVLTVAGVFLFSNSHVLAASPAVKSGLIAFLTLLHGILNARANRTQLLAAISGAAAAARKASPSPKLTDGVLDSLAPDLREPILRERKNFLTPLQERIGESA